MKKNSFMEFFFVSHAVLSIQERNSALKKQPKKLSSLVTRQKKHEVEGVLIWWVLYLHFPSLLNSSLNTEQSQDQSD